MPSPEQNNRQFYPPDRNNLKGSQESWEQLWQDGNDVNYLDPGSFAGINERIKVDSFIDKFLQASGKRSLECGCGLATVSMLLADRGTLLLGDINAIPSPDSTYDLVHSYGVLEHFAEIEKPMEEMLRVLKPGGVFFADIVPANQGLIHTTANAMNHTVIFAGSILRLRMRKW